MRRRGARRRWRQSEAGLRRALVMMLPLIAACAGPGPEATQGPLRATYEGVETRLLDGDLVQFTVSMRGARGAEDVEAYADCAAAQYTLIRGFGFARHVRTITDERAGIWRADAVYTISAAIPAGLMTIDAEVTVAHCGLAGIPTV